MESRDEGTIWGKDGMLSFNNVSETDSEQVTDRA